MLILECPYCGVKAEEIELTLGFEAHLSLSAPDASAETSTAGVVH